MIIHVLADGSRTTDINGHVVKYDPESTLYQLITRINEEETKDVHIKNNRRLSYA